MQPRERALHFTRLHIKGNPLVVYNGWDAGSAKAITSGSAPAIATSSWAVAAAQGYQDGQSIPLSFVQRIIAQIVHSVEVPVTVDVEGAYDDDPQLGADNIARLLDHGVIGINFEDRVVSATGLHTVEAQCERIAAIRRMAEARGVPLFINARSDVFFGTGVTPADGLAEARERAAAYAEVGASGFFVPGLVDLPVIARLCDKIDLPLNVMMMPGLPNPRALAAAG